MSANDPNVLFRRAEAHFSAGEHAEALRIAEQINRAFGAHAPVLHLAAIAHRRLGASDAARSAFEGALRLAPDDPHIRSNYANLLADLGDVQAALDHLGRVAAAHPRFVDAHVNRALLLQQLGRFTDALAALERLDISTAKSTRVLTIRAAILRDLGHLDRAAAALDAALAQEPDRATALVGRARIALERGEADASARYARALAVRPGDIELELGRALALEAGGDAQAISALDGILQRQPEWVEAHEQYARMQSEAGRTDAITQSYAQAIRRLPDHLPLHLSHWRTLIRAQRFADAVAAIAAAPIGVRDTQEAQLIRAICSSEAGDVDAADRLFVNVADGSEARLARGRHALRAGRPDEAARLLEHVAAENPDNITAWAHLTLAWRLIGDARIDWLCGQPGLWDTTELPLAPEELGALAALLRTLHRTRAHPIGQSLRGGTQTRGRLLVRQEPLLALLRGHLERAVAGHVQALPPADPSHPLLRHRGKQFAFTGSWSVRLTGSGFHVSHIHPMGTLSSAFYVAVPDDVSGSATREGWLELGTPPSELGLDVAPLAVIQPRPGSLVLFPSYFFHSTRPFATGERLTVAFDIAAIS